MYNGKHTHVAGRITQNKLVDELTQRPSVIVQGTRVSLKAN